MGYTYTIDPKAMFKDRAGQFVTLGVPQADVAAMEAAITDMWADAPGGWPYEWSKVAAGHEAAGQDFVASLAYGCAKFPCLAGTAARTKALAEQVRTYTAAAAAFPVAFERRVLTLPAKGGTVPVPVHLFRAAPSYAEAPVIVFNGGVDTWKMDIHAICVGLAEKTRATILAFDQPGTGETPVPLTGEADSVVLGLVQAAKGLGNGKVVHFGMSFGANYAAMTGLTHAVDAAIVLGGPVEAAFGRDNLDRLPFGMANIVGNAVGFAGPPTTDALVAAMAGLVRTGLLAGKDNAPMLVINGAEDYFVPAADTLVFQGRPRTEVALIPGTGHCAFSKLQEVLGMVLKWLPGAMGAAGTGAGAAPAAKG